MVHADMVLHNGKVATVDAKFSFYEAVAVKDGWIIAVGTNEEIKPHIGQNTKVVDLGGKVLLPGANDAHMHAVHTGLKRGSGFLDVGFPNVKSVKDIQNLIAEAIKTSPPGAWICGMGWMSGMLEELAAEGGRPLCKEDLDPVSPDNPVMLSDFGLHSLVVNSKALEVAGIDDDYPAIPPEVGYINRDENGKLTGIFREWGAQQILTKAGPILDEQEMEECILRMQKLLNSYGVTSHVDILGIGGDKLICGSWGQKAIDVYEKMAREGKLTARVSVNVFAAVDGVQSYEAITEGIKQTTLPDFQDKNWVKADCIKVFGDGAAWYRKERDIPEHGRSVFPGETEDEQETEIFRTLVEIHRLGWQVGIHAIGGRTIDTAVAAFKEGQQLYPRETPRHFIIHADDISMENVDDMAKYNILCSPQPVAGNIVAGFMSKVIGEDLFNWQEYTNRGVVVTGGSDSSCFSCNWLEGVQFAVTRTTGMGVEVRPDLGMSLEDAIRMYTINGAYQERMENVRGSIEVGKVADLQVLGQDIFEVPKGEIGKIPVVMTVCGGKIVHEA